MRLDLARLPTDIALLQRVVRDLVEVVERQEAELDEHKARVERQEADLERLRCLLSMLKRRAFGRGSEKRDPDQLNLAACRS